jgi:hypothetical protein
MHKARESVVMKSQKLQLTSILWTLEDVKQLQNKQTVEMEELKKKLVEKEEKGGTKEMVDAMGGKLAAVSQKVEGLIKVVDDILAKKPN